MKTLILSPIFPPDIGDPAPYTKLLTHKLSHHETTLLIYGFLPESVAGLQIITIDKRKPRLLILLSSFRQLMKLRHDHDVIIVNNGPSSELPALLLSFFTKKPILLSVSDHLAEDRSRTGWYKFVHALFLKRVAGTIRTPEDKNIFMPAEKLPFSASDPEKEKRKNVWWSDHVKEIESYVR